MRPAVVLSDQRAGLAAVMEQRGLWPQHSPWVRQAVEALPREEFAPARLWRWTGHAYVPVDRDADEEQWAAEVYGDPFAAAVTQVTDGMASSSLSCQAIVADMLDSLLLEPGHRVLELGTGTGWNAALLAWQAGAGRVTSVEVDLELARQAGERLEAAGTAVNIGVGDGGRGWPAGGPYDRVISTYAVDTAPWAWVEQTRPGGRIVTPWGRLGHVALTVADDGRSATGWVQGLAQFMSARGTATPDRAHTQVRGTGPAGDERRIKRDMAPLRDNWNLLFALRVAVPDLRVTTRTDEDVVYVWLHDNVSSWAALTTAGGGSVTYEGGPRDLVDELAAAWDGWEAAGSPRLYDYGMTVTPDKQYMWAVDPVTGPRWPAPRLPAAGQPVSPPGPRSHSRT